MFGGRVWTLRLRRPSVRLFKQLLPSLLWRLHLGHFKSKTFLVIIMSVGSTSSVAAISELRILFSHYDIPEIVVSGNGTSFTSREFQDFLAANGVKHLKSTPYHPATNGLVERAVQNCKMWTQDSAGLVEGRLAHVLFAYRITSQSNTGMTPDELLLKCKIRM